MCGCSLYCCSSLGVHFGPFNCVLCISVISVHFDCILLLSRMGNYLQVVCSHTLHFTFCILFDEVIFSLCGTVRVCRFAVLAFDLCIFG